MSKIEIIKEYTIALDSYRNIIFSSFFEYNSTVYAINNKQPIIYELYHIPICSCENYHNECENTLHCFKVNNLYSKIVYNELTNSFLAFSMHCPNLLYILDNCFEEINLMQINYNNCCKPIIDISINFNTQLIYTLSANNINCFNFNSDYLNTFMSSSKDKTYSAITIYNNSVFIAYRKSNCTYIALYTLTGTYLENIVLGCEYFVNNMQVILCDCYNILKVFVVKNGRFPCIIEIKITKDTISNNDCKYNSIHYHF